MHILTAGMISTSKLAVTTSILLVSAELEALEPPARFESQIAAFETMDAEQPPPKDPVVFVGSSTIAGWPNLEMAFPEHPILNRGFGGSVMNDVLYYFDRVVAIYQPALVVVYEGDNDLAAGLTVAEAHEDFMDFANLMKERTPKSDFAFISVKPSPSRSGLFEAIVELNDKLEALALERGGYYIDVHTPMLDASGDPLPHLFASDNLHLSSSGYRLWKNVVGATLAQWSEQRKRSGRFVSITIKEGAIELIWEGEGRLEAADSIKGPWVEAPPIGSGTFRETVSSDNRFYRLAMPE